jgi:hypothetical protein
MPKGSDILITQHARKAPAAKASVAIAHQTKFTSSIMSPFIGDCAPVLALAAPGNSQGQARP